MRKSIAALYCAVPAITLCGQDMKITVCLSVVFIVFKSTVWLSQMCK
jgi:hypothetical protein